MIIKSHVRGGFRAAAQYLSERGQNEKTRLVEISDPDATDLAAAFRNMWIIASGTKVKKPLHHISLNPYKDERLTDDQVRKIVARAGLKFGYIPGDHQHVIVEHILNGRQHFHVMWNRVSLATNKAVWPGEHWKKSKQTAREMERELNLKCPARRSAIASPSSVVRFHPGRSRQSKPHRILRPIRPVTVWSHASRASAPSSTAPPMFANATMKGWPPAAVEAWNSWGHRQIVRFFKVWIELAPPGFS